MLKKILLIISSLLYVTTALILLSGVPQLLAVGHEGEFHISWISLILTIFIILIHGFVVWNIIKRKHITLILAPCFEAYFLYNLYLFLKPFSADKLLVFEAVTYSELMMATGIIVLVICAFRLIPLIIYRQDFIN